MKTKVKVTYAHRDSDIKKGAVGYIDGYICGELGPCAIVVIDNKIHAIVLWALEVMNDYYAKHDTGFQDKMAEVANEPKPPSTLLQNADWIYCTNCGSEICRTKPEYVNYERILCISCYDEQERQMKNKSQKT